MFIWQKYIECYRCAKKVRGVYLFIFPQILKMHDLTKKICASRWWHAKERDTHKNMDALSSYNTWICAKIMKKIGGWGLKIAKKIGGWATVTFFCWPFLYFKGHFNNYWVTFHWGEFSGHIFYLFSGFPREF